jgi:Sulfotransferase family
VPDFFLVGTPKTGTTSLHRTLRAHPQIFMPELKEPRFLASDMAPREGFEDGPREDGYPRTLDEYLALFAPASPEQRAGEATTTYLWSRTAAQAIARLQPRARIVATFREPASFLRSLHLTFLLGRNETERDLRRALALEDERRAGRSIPPGSHRPQLLLYSEHVRYAEQLRRFRERFPPEQMLVHAYDDFREDNERVVEGILRFLDVDERAPLELANVNVTRRAVRSWRGKDMLDDVTLGRNPVAKAARRTVKAVTTQSMRHGAARTLQQRVVEAEVEPPDEELMAELRVRFKPAVVELSELLDRDLVTLWGYDKL